MTKPIIFVATWEDGLFAITNKGRTQEIAHQAVRGLSSDGSNGVLAIIGGHSLQRRTSIGEWTAVASSELNLSCCMAVRDTIYVGTDNARLLRLSPGSSFFEPIDSFDEVEGRDTWFAGSAIVNGQRMGPPLGIRSMAANSNGAILLANVHVGGIPRSTDGGKTWQPTIDINTDVHEVRAHETDPNIVAAASATGLCLSRDAGATWIIEREGLHASHCSAVTFSGNDVFLSASADPFAAQGKVYRRPLKPDGSIVAEYGLPTWLEGIVDTGCIAGKGSSIAVVDRGGNVYNSDDFGRTWRCQSTKLPTPSSVLIC